MGAYFIYAEGREDIYAAVGGDNGRVVVRRGGECSGQFERLGWTEFMLPSRAIRGMNTIMYR